MRCCMWKGAVKLKALEFMFHLFCYQPTLEEKIKHKQVLIMGWVL